LVALSGQTPGFEHVMYGAQVAFDEDNMKAVVLVVVIARPSLQSSQCHPNRVKTSRKENHGHENE